MRVFRFDLFFDLELQLQTETSANRHERANSRIFVMALEQARERRLVDVMAVSPLLDRLFSSELIQLTHHRFQRFVIFLSSLHPPFCRGY